MACIWLQRYLFCLLLIPLHNSAPLLKTGMLAFTWWHYLMDKLTFLEIQIQQPWELQHPPAQGELIFPKKVITQQGTIKETTKTWIPGFQLHIEPEQQQQQTKGTGLASALNQGQMQLLQARMDAGGGWKRGAGSSRAKRSPAPEKGTPSPVGLRTAPNLLPLFLHKSSWCSSP